MPHPKHHTLPHCSEDKPVTLRIVFPCFYSFFIFLWYHRSLLLCWSSSKIFQFLTRLDLYSSTSLSLPFLPSYLRPFSFPALSFIIHDHPNFNFAFNAETNYVEDVLAAGSFFHYAEGYSKPEAFDLTLPETNPVGKLKGEWMQSQALNSTAQDRIPYWIVIGIERIRQTASFI